MQRPRDYLNRRRFKRTTAQAEAADQMVCAAIAKGGKPLYFSMPRNTPLEKVQERAFELREGRNISPGERTLLAMAARRIQPEPQSA